ncbi:MAG: uracil-DNA glycosylase [Alphaproteobacteria bacterium]|nr:uracil-DNA glycosylase [Alphaproteobacteria bacterium]
MGLDEAIADAPQDAFARSGAEKAALSARDQRPAATIGRSFGPGIAQEDVEPPSRTTARPSTIVTTSTPSADEAAAEAERIAAACASIDELEEAIAGFDGCPLKKGARSTVVRDGVIGSDLLVIGEAPGRDEDRIGKPFVGRAGQLLDRMLAAIGRTRADNTLITNVIYWRPPGNRTPTDAEILVCRPFVERFITIAEPKAIAVMGGVALKGLSGETGITRARGRWRDLELGGATRPAIPMFHPAFLLRRPEQKRLAWADLQALDAKLNGG